MSKEQILDWQHEGFEVACHGKTHNNTVQDVLGNIEELKTFGVDVENIGFASPGSELTLNNIHSTGIDELKRNGTISICAFWSSGSSRRCIIYFGSAYGKIYARQKTLVDFKQEKYNKAG